jgi:hypothetical protein
LDQAPLARKHRNALWKSNGECSRYLANLASDDLLWSIEFALKGVRMIEIETRRDLVPNDSQIELALE